MDYFAIKTLHQAAVALSIGGFFARGVGSLLGAAWVGGRLAKTLPHIVDTVLLASALFLAWTLRLDPVHAPSLIAQIVGLVVYLMLFGLALCSAVLAGHGMAGSTRRDWLHAISFVVILSLALYLIVDFEFPRLGLITVNEFESMVVKLTGAE